MSTMEQLVNRTFRTYLEPPDSQPATARLQAAITDLDTQLTIGGFALGEDELLLRPECELEIGNELLLVTAYDDQTGVCDVERAYLTEAEDHALGARIKIAPPFSRQSVFEALADNIITLYPDVYQVDSRNLSTVGWGVAAIDDPLAVEVVEVWDHTASTSDTNGVRIVDFHPQVGGRAVITPYPMGSFWIRYRKRFAAATSMEDTFADLGLEERWAHIVMIGACADLMIGRDIDATHSKFISGALEAENVPVGTRVQLGSQMASYRQRLLHEAKQEMRAEYKAKVTVVQSTMWD